jgi:hypothetical protein
LLVLINWAWDYLFYERAVRLILPLPWQADARRSEPLLPETAAEASRPLHS